MPQVERIPRFLGILLVALLLSGCTLVTVDQMYAPPRRSQEDRALQSAIDQAMTGLEYSAPAAGEYQQTVQTADLDGDGEEEYLLFAKAREEKPLRILIFHRQDGGFYHTETLESYGERFDRVEYAQLDGKGGVEIVVGVRLSDKLPRSVSAYAWTDGESVRLLSATCSAFLTLSMDAAPGGELLLLRPGEGENDPGIAELYTFLDGATQRSNRVEMSAPTARLRRVLTGALADGTPAVFAASSAGEGNLITDVFALLNGELRNVSPGGALRGDDVLAEDIDGDGILELPQVLARQPDGEGSLIRWYALAPDGSEKTKRYTFHDFTAGWYLDLDPGWVDRVTVAQREDAWEFSLTDEKTQESRLIFTIYAFSGADRDAQAVSRNRFLLLRAEQTTFAARLEADSAAVTRQGLMDSFHLILRDWKTGEM